MNIPFKIFLISLFLFLFSSWQVRYITEKTAKTIASFWACSTLISAIIACVSVIIGVILLF